MVKNRNKNLLVTAAAVVAAIGGLSVVNTPSAHAMLPEPGAAITFNSDTFVSPDGGRCINGVYTTSKGHIVTDGSTCGQAENTNSTGFTFEWSDGNRTFSASNTNSEAVVS